MVGDNTWAWQLALVFLTSKPHHSSKCPLGRFVD